MNCNIAVSVGDYTHPFNAPFSGNTQVSRYQKGKTILDFTEARDSEWQWHQLGHMQVCTLLQADNHASTPPLSFLQAGCPSCRPTNSVKALGDYFLENLQMSGNLTVAIEISENCPKMREMAEKNFFKERVCIVYFKLQLLGFHQCLVDCF